MRRKNLTAFFQAVLEACASLTPRELELLILRYTQGKSSVECAKHFNVTKERIRQIENEAYATFMKELETPLRIEEPGSSDPKPEEPKVQEVPPVQPKIRQPYINQPQ